MTLSSIIYLSDSFCLWKKGPVQQQRGPRKRIFKGLKVQDRGTSKVKLGLLYVLLRSSVVRKGTKTETSLSSHKGLLPHPETAVTSCPVSLPKACLSGGLIHLGAA